MSQQSHVDLVADMLHEAIYPECIRTEHPGSRYIAKMRRAARKAYYTDAEYTDQMISAIEDRINEYVTDHERVDGSETFDGFDFD